MDEDTIKLIETVSNNISKQIGDSLDKFFKFNIEVLKEDIRNMKIEAERSGISMHNSMVVQHNLLNAKVELLEMKIDKLLSEKHE